MKAKISFSLVDASKNPLEWMYRVEDAGFQGWEILCEGVQEVKGEFKEWVREIHETTNLVLSLHAPFSGINIASVNERRWKESVRQIKESIANAYEFIDDICVVHPGVFSPLSIQMPEKAAKKSISGLMALSDFAADRGLRIAVENLGSVSILLGRYPDELVHLVRGANRDNLGICFDVAHAHTTKTVDEFLNITARTEDKDIEIIHMHASDNFGAEDLHLPLGKGSQDWKKIFSGINDTEYEGLVVLEHYRMEDGIESLEFISNVSVF